MSAPSPFIDDGYTRDGRFLECEWHPEINYLYRPSTSPERTTYSLQIDRWKKSKDPDEALKKIDEFASKLIAEKISEWDISDRDGNEVEITKENVARLEPHLFQKFYLVVLGNKPPYERYDNEETEDLTDDDLEKN